MTEAQLARLIRNVIDLQGLSNHVSRQGQHVIERSINEIVQGLIKNDPTDVARRYQAARLERVMQQVGVTMRVQTKGLTRELRRELARIGVQQGAWAAGTVDIGFRAAPSLTRFKAIIDANPFEGLTLAQWSDGLSARTLLRVRQELQLGLTHGEGIGALVRRIKGTVFDIASRDAAAVTRTAVNFISTQAHLTSYRDLGVEFVRFSAVLDDRTTLICGSLDGNVYSLDDSKLPVPPLHYQCRSMLMPEVRGARNEKISYGDWLRSLPKMRQVEILGPGRAAAFRRGVSLKKMVNDDLMVVRLEELAA